MPPEHAGDGKRQRTRGRLTDALGLLLRSIAGVYNWIVGIILFGLAGAPAYIFISWAWPLLDRPEILVEAIYRSGLLFAGYLVFGLSLLIVIVVLAFVFRLRATPGHYTMRDPALMSYFTYNVMIVAARLFFLPVVRFSPVQVWFYRGLGAKIGKHVVINSVHVYDLNLITLEDHVVIGGSAKVMAHAGQGNRLVIGPVHVGRGATIGESAIVMPGARIGAGAVIGAASVVPVGFEVPPGSRWSGVPIRRVDGDDGA